MYNVKKKTIYIFVYGCRVNFHIVRSVQNGFHNPNCFWWKPTAHIHIKFQWDNDMEGNEAYTVEKALRTVFGSMAKSDGAHYYADRADMTLQCTYAKAFRYNASLCDTGQCGDERLTRSSGVSIYIDSEAAAIFSKSCNINIDWVSSCEVGAKVIVLFESQWFVFNLNLAVAGPCHVCLQ